MRTYVLNCQLHLPSTKIEKSGVYKIFLKNVDRVIIYENKIFLVSYMNLI